MSVCVSSVTLYGVFPYCRHREGVTQCLLLELLDVSVSELLVSGSAGCHGTRSVS